MKIITYPRANVYSFGVEYARVRPRYLVPWHVALYFWNRVIVISGDTPGMETPA